MIHDEERELRFQRWREHIRKLGKADEKVLRYLWDLYDELLEQIRELKKLFNNNNHNNN